MTLDVYLQSSILGLRPEVIEMLRGRAVRQFSDYPTLQVIRSA